MRGFFINPRVAVPVCILLLLAALAAFWPATPHPVSLADPQIKWFYTLNAQTSLEATVAQADRVYVVSISNISIEDPAVPAREIELTGRLMPSLFSTPDT